MIWAAKHQASAFQQKLGVGAERLHRGCELSLFRIAVLLFFSGIISAQCASVEQLIRFQSESLPLNQAQERQDYTGPRFKAVMIEFGNSAQIDKFEVTADADLTTTGIEQADLELNRDSSNENASATDQKTPESSAIRQSAASQADLAKVAREVTETALFQSGRFEIVPLFQFQAARTKHLEAGRSEAEATRLAAKELNIDYLFYGDLTNFEIKTATSYWKVPFWAILLVGSFFIDDDRTRFLVWEAMLRAATIVPLESALWKAGVGQQDIDLDLSLSLDLRMVDAREMLVVFSDSRTIIRTENASNLELVVWQSDNKVRIKSSNAGKQIRFAAYAVTRVLRDFIDQKTGYRPAQLPTRASSPHQPAVHGNHIHQTDG